MDVCTDGRTDNMRDNNDPYRPCLWVGLVDQIKSVPYGKKSMFPPKARRKNARDNWRPKGPPKGKKDGGKKIFFHGLF